MKTEKNALLAVDLSIRPSPFCRDALLACGLLYIELRVRVQWTSSSIRVCTRCDPRLYPVQNRLLGTRCKHYTALPSCTCRSHPCSRLRRLPPLPFPATTADHGPRQQHPLETTPDTISEVLAYCPDNYFLFLASVSRSWKRCWERSARPKRTSVSLATATAGRVEDILDQPSFHAASSHLGGVLCLAAQAGNLGGLRAAARKIGDSWSSLAAAVTMTGTAASEGHLGVLQWAVVEGCRLSVHTMRCAIEGGHLGVVRWCSEQGCPWPGDACRLAALGGHLGVLRLARAEGLPWSEETCMSAAEAGDLETLRFARQSGCPWDSRTASSAAWGDNFEVLKWAVAAGCPMSDDVSYGAALSGNLAMLRWVRGEGHRFDRRTCSYAALGGHLEVLRFLRSAECPMDEDTSACAAQGGHLEVLRWGGR